MYRISLVLLIVLAISCKHDKNHPDVSSIKVSVPVQRFEKSLFNLDTNQMVNGLPALQRNYPTFLPIFLNNILGLPRWDASTAPVYDQQLRFFVRQGRGLYDAAEQKYADFSDVQRQFEEAFRYVKYYYPGYKTPKLITLIGPIDALAKLNNSYIPDFLGRDFLGISLQFYLGRTFPIYQDQNYMLNVVPEFRSRRFDKPYIIADGMQVIVDDIYADTSATRPLIEQMIEKGKQWYLLDHFLPEAPDSIKTGYTQKQLQWCKENEGNIWTYITKNTDLYTIDPETIKVYIGESPSTEGMPEASPGNIGPWVGLQIVNAYAARHTELSLQKVLATPSNALFQESRYKPR